MHVGHPKLSHMVAAQPSYSRTEPNLNLKTVVSEFCESPCYSASINNTTARLKFVPIHLLYGWAGTSR